MHFSGRALPSFRPQSCVCMCPPHDIVLPPERRQPFACTRAFAFIAFKVVFPKQCVVVILNHEATDVQANKTGGSNFSGRLWISQLRRHQSPKLLNHRWPGQTAPTSASAHAPVVRLAMQGFRRPCTDLLGLGLDLLQGIGLNLWVTRF